MICETLVCIQESYYQGGRGVRQHTLATKIWYLPKMPPYRQYTFKSRTPRNIYRVPQGKRCIQVKSGLKRLYWPQSLGPSPNPTMWMMQYARKYLQAWQKWIINIYRPELLCGLWPRGSGNIQGPQNLGPPLIPPRGQCRFTSMPGNVYRLLHSKKVLTGACFL